jgi:two-component system nitrate/nitrite response regulator NarL
MRCLVVDDRAEDRFLVERMLRRNGYRATCLPNGQAALAAMQQERFDVALVDLGMESMPGVEVIRELRKVDRGIRILVVSGFDDHKHILEALEAGANGYILKDELGERLGGALQEIFAGGSPLSARVGSVVLRHAFTRPSSPPEGLAIGSLRKSSK